MVLVVAELLKTGLVVLDADGGVVVLLELLAAAGALVALGTGPLFVVLTGVSVVLEVLAVAGVLIGGLAGAGALGVVLAGGCGRGRVCASACGWARGRVCGCGGRDLPSMTLRRVTDTRRVRGHHRPDESVSPATLGIACFQRKRLSPSITRREPGSRRSRTGRRPGDGYRFPEVPEVR